MKRTSLRSSYAEKIKSGQKEYKPLKAKSSLRDSYANKVKNNEKKAYVPPKPKTNNKKKLKSVFTNDLYTCIISGTKNNIHVHHIFEAANKANSEKYGFLIPLSAHWHDMSNEAIHFNRELDLKWKRKCQDYWLENYGTKEEFIKIFRKWW